MKSIMKRVLAPATVAAERGVAGARCYRAVVCTELLPPPPFKAGALRVKDLPSITPRKGEVTSLYYSPEQTQQNCPSLPPPSQLAARECSCLFLCLGPALDDSLLSCQITSRSCWT